MAHFDLEEQEQLDSIKTWWKMYGNLVTGVVTLVSIVVIGWQGWNWYERQQAAQAAAVFSVLERAIEANDAQKQRAAAGELTEKYARTLYAPMGALLSARQSADAGDYKTARTQLSWVVSHARDEWRDLARLRLAAVLLDDEAYDQAIQLMGETPAEAFKASYLEMKGDAFWLQGKATEAKAAYAAALALLSGKTGPASELLRQKLDALGGAV